jgi:integrase
MATVTIGKIRARKDRGTYEAVYYVSGIRRRVSAETKERVSSKLAECVEDAKQEPETTGIWNINVTIGEYAESWLKTVEKELEPQTFASYKHLLETHILPFEMERKKLSAFKVRELKRRHIKFLIAKKSDIYAKDTVRLMRSVLSSLLTDAQDDEIIENNPALMLFRKKRKRTRQHERDITPMNEAEFTKFLDTARNEKPYGSFLTILGKAGLRPSEAIALTPQDVRFESKTVRIEKVFISGRVRPYTKTGIKRDVDLSPEMIALLRSHIAQVRATYLKEGKPQPEMLFPTLAGTYIDKNNAKRAFHRICKKAKIGHFRMYDLRHTFASLLLASATPITYVAAQLGHTKPTTTLRYYAKWIPKEGLRYVDVLDMKADTAEAVLG